MQSRSSSVHGLLWVSYSSRPFDDASHIAWNTASMMRFAFNRFTRSTSVLEFFVCTRRFLMISGSSNRKGEGLDMSKKEGRREGNWRWYVCKKKKKKKKREELKWNSKSHAFFHSLLCVYLFSSSSLEEKEMIWKVIYHSLTLLHFVLWASLLLSFS